MSDEKSESRGAMTITINSQLLEQMLHWSDQKPTVTRNGAKFVRTATPTGEFWKLWRDEANKQALRDLGISPKPGVGNEWVINWYSTNLQGTPTQVAAEVAKTTTTINWSSEQEAIFEWFRNGTGALVVRARAGTGKTTTIKQAFTYAREQKMLYAAFNKKNRKEAEKSIFDPRVEIKTLHSVGYDFIKTVWPHVKPDDRVENDRVEQIVGKDTAREIKTQVKRLVGFCKNCLIRGEIDQVIALAEQRNIECPNFEDEANGGWDRVKLAAHAVRVLELSREPDPQGRISFNDMVWLPVRQGWVRAWFDLVVVDEAQDMNLPQLTMAMGAVKTGGRIVVVGDDRQAIYFFRGAASDGMDMMKAKLNAKELSLTITYRCPKAVVRLAAALVPDYKAADAAPEGVIEACEVNAIPTTAAIGDAILSRSNAPLMPICLALLRRGTPARIEGKDIGKSLLEIVENLNARSVPQFMQKVETWQDRQIHRFEKSDNFEEKAAEIRDQAETLMAIAENAVSVREIETRLGTLFQNSDDEGVKPAVVLSTTHKAKGLEWSKVYLLRDTFNKKRPASAPPLSPEAEAANAKESANIYYVALTRTKHTLVMANGQFER